MAKKAKSNINKSSSSQGKENTLRRDLNWINALDLPLRQSIDFYSDPDNVGKKAFATSNWFLATNGKLTKKSRSLIRRLKPIKGGLVKDALNTAGLNQYQVKARSKRKFNALSKKAEKRDLLLWFEPTIVGKELDGTTTLGSIGENSIDLTNTPNHWNLYPTGTLNNTFGIDATGAWSIANGEGVTVGISDTTQDLTHPDLLSAMQGADNDGNTIPDSFEVVDVQGTDSHGTAVAGIAVARINNNDAVGIAHRADYFPARAWFNNNGDLNAPSRLYTQSGVVNHSWGITWGGIPRDNGSLQTLPPNPMSSWIRNLNGAIRVMSSGNQRDRRTDNNGNTWGGWNNYNNDNLFVHRSQIGVAATRSDGEVEIYSTHGANVFISAPVNILTSDVQDNADGTTRGYSAGNITPSFNGTSAAAPTITGVIGLMLEANPRLSARDIQHIFVDTSQKNNTVDSDGDGITRTERRNTFTTGVQTSNNNTNEGYNTGWFRNGAGHWVSDSFGFGIVDANQAVQAAQNWGNTNPELKVETSRILANGFQIPEGNLGGLNSLQTAGSWNVRSNLNAEWVEVTLDLNNFTEQDEVMLALRSPSGTRSVLMGAGGNNNTSFNGERTFRSNQFWDENINGQWTLEALDTISDGDSQRIADAKIDFYGTCATPSPLEVKPPRNTRELQELAKQLIIDGTGSDAFELISAEAIGPGQAMASLSKGNESGLLIDKGVLLTSGKATNAIGPNKAKDTSTILNSGSTHLFDAITRDSVGIDIRIKPERDLFIQLDVQFGSEEFDEFSPSEFYDSAGLFIGDVTKNPKVELRNANVSNFLRGPNGEPFSVNGFSEDPNIREKYTTTNPICGETLWEYDGGNADIISSRGVTLEAGNSYTITPIIADVGDSIYDSGILFGSV